MLPFAHFVMGSSSRAPGKLLWETVDVAEGEGGCGVQDQRRILRVPSTEWKHGSVGSLLQPSAPCTSYTQKGKGQKGTGSASKQLLIPLHNLSCRGWTCSVQCVLLWQGHSRSQSTGKVLPSQGDDSLESHSGKGESSPLCFREKQRNSLDSVPAAGHSARLTMQTPCRLTVTPVRAPPPRRGLGPMVTAPKLGGSLSHRPQSTHSSKKEKRLENNKQDAHPTLS